MIELDSYHENRAIHATALQERAFNWMSCRSNWAPKHVNGGLPIRAFLRKTLPQSPAESVF